MERQLDAQAYLIRERRGEDCSSEFARDRGALELHLSPHPLTRDRGHHHVELRVWPELRPEVVRTRVVEAECAHLCLRAVGKVAAKESTLLDVVYWHLEACSDERDLEIEVLKGPAIAHTTASARHRGGDR